MPSPKAGYACAFFRCRTSASRIRAELPDIREMAQTPQHVKMLLVEGPMNAEGAKKDSELMMRARKAVATGCNYSLEAIYPGESNEKASEELVMVLNIAKMGSPLYEKGEGYRGDIYYRQGGSYVSRE